MSTQRDGVVRQRAEWMRPVDERIETIRDEAETQGNLTAPEIAGILNEHELPVTDETTSSVGPE